jgi:hypothetical protein
MHQVFAIPELLYLIFAEISNDDQALLSLARTCRRFHQPSVAILWRNLDSVLPLMKLLPEDSVTFERTEDSQVKNFYYTCIVSDERVFTDIFFA